ncbi:MAG: hypothetical protein HeimC3_49760 [Candidatus Heimdallarchaeota archaeon LC_3]|nr:MAG: hypothetical protein HeimC3_49760 [Candidatus Heimdallarchaeota archaeon LC_3]
MSILSTFPKTVCKTFTLKVYNLEYEFKDLLLKIQPINKENLLKESIIIQKDGKITIDEENYKLKFISTFLVENLAKEEFLIQITKLKENGDDISLKVINHIFIDIFEEIFYSSLNSDDLELEIKRDLFKGL